MCWFAFLALGGRPSLLSTMMSLSIPGSVGLDIIMKGEKITGAEAVAHVLIFGAVFLFHAGPPDVFKSGSKVPAEGTIRVGSKLSGRLSGSMLHRSVVDLDIDGVDVSRGGGVFVRSSGEAIV